MSRMNNRTPISSGDRLDTQDYVIADAKIWKMLHIPKHAKTSPTGQVIYAHHNPEDRLREVN
jgi:hypothetical protein